MKQKVTPDQYNHFLTNFNNQSGLRVGQAFLNKYIEDPDPRLFYEICDDTAWQIIIDEYVDWH